MLKSNKQQNHKNPTPQFFGSGAINLDWKSFLIQYLNGLNTIPYATTPTAHYLDSLSIDQRTLWLTLLPALARHRKISKAIQPDGAELLNNVIDWARELIKKYIDSE